MSVPASRSVHWSLSRIVQCSGHGIRNLAFVFVHVVSSWKTCVRATIVSVYFEVMYLYRRMHCRSGVEYQWCLCVPGMYGIGGVCVCVCVCVCVRVRVH